MSIQIAIHCDEPGCHLTYNGDYVDYSIVELRDESREHGWTSVYRGRGQRHPDDFCPEHSHA